MRPMPAHSSFFYVASSARSHQFLTAHKLHIIYVFSLSGYGRLGLVIAGSRRDEKNYLKLNLGQFILSIWTLVSDSINIWPVILIAN